MKDFLTSCKRLLTVAVLGCVLAAPHAAAATAEALHAEAGALLRQARAQEQELAQLHERTQAGPLGWAAWWGWVAAAGLLAPAAWVLARRRPMVDAQRPEETEEDEVQAPAVPRPAAVAQRQASLPPQPVTGTPPKAAVPPSAPRPVPPVDLAARADALLALLGEVEFLASIGLDQGAVDALEQHLARTTRPAPLAWLELLDLHHRLGEADGAADAWRRFTNAFPAAAACGPERLLDPQTGLEALPQTLERVEAAWRSPDLARQLASQLLDGDAVLLPLGAARDLADLLRVARDDGAPAAAAPAAAPAPDESFERTVVFSASEWVRHLASLDLAPREGVSAVDIDLGIPNDLAHARASVRTADPTQMAPDLVVEAPVLEMDSWRDELFDAATGFERRRAAARVDPAYR